MISLLLAAALQSAGDIKTGQDLLRACQQSDTKACDTFISQVVAGDVECIYSAKEARDLRRRAIKLAIHNRTQPAVSVVWKIPVSATLCEADGGRR